MNLSSGTQSLIAGALFDFMGRLTTRSKILEMGATKNTQPVLDVFKVWAKERGLNIDKAMVEDWNTLPAQVTIASVANADGVEEGRIAGALVSYVEYLQAAEAAETDDYEGAFLRWASKTGLEVSNPQKRWSSVWWA